jgi:hypothetical protein
MNFKSGGNEQDSLKIAAWISKPRMDLKYRDNHNANRAIYFQTIRPDSELSLKS